MYKYIFVKFKLALFLSINCDNLNQAAIVNFVVINRSNTIFNFFTIYLNLLFIRFLSTDVHLKKSIVKGQLYFVH